MTFAYPIFFLAPLIYVLARLLFRSRTTHGISAPSGRILKSLPVSLRLRLRGPAILALEIVTVSSLTVAAARPQKITIIDQPNLGRNIMLVIDTSHSMSGEDFPTSFGVTSRMEGVKTVVAEYVRTRKHDRVGLIVFGNTSYLQSPLTSDTLLVETLVKHLQPRMAGDGTAIGDGLGLALKRLRDLTDRSKAIILITDGVNTAGQVNPIKAARIAKDLGIQIHTIGIGSGTVQLGRGPIGGLLGSRSGISAEFDEETLKEIASMTNGVYFNAQSLDGFKQVYQQIDQLAQTEDKQPERPIIHELFMPWAIISFIAFLVSVALQSTIFRRIP